MTTAWNMTRLRRAAVTDHACPWCLRPAGAECVRKGTQQESAIPHDPRQELAGTALIEQAQRDLADRVRGVLP